MTALPSPRLPPSRRSEPAYREQRRQKVEEYLSRKKTFSGVRIQENQASFSSRTGKVTSNKLQDKIQALKSAKPKMKDTENADKLSWDQSSRTLEENVALKSSTITLANSTLETSYNPEDLTSKDEVTEIKPQHISLSQSFLHVRSIKERQLIAEKQNSNISLPKKPVPGKYRGKVIQSKINSFRKAPKSEEGKSSLPDKKPLISATKPSVRSLSTSNCNVVMKTIKVTNSPNSVKSNGVLPFQSKPAIKAINSQSSLSKQQSTSAVSLTKVTVRKMIGRRGPVPQSAASNNSEQKTLAVKKSADSCEDARPEATAKAISVAPVTRSRQDSKVTGNRKSVLPKQSAEERRVRLAEWRATKGKVMKRPPLSVFLGTQSKSEAQEISSADDSLEHLLHDEKVNKTLSECLQLTEQGCQRDEVHAMLQDLIKNTPRAKKLAKYWICCMHLEQMGPLEKLIVVYEEAILAGAMPKDQLRCTLIDIMKNTESLFKSEDGGAVIEAHLSEVAEVSKEANASAEQVQEVFKDVNSDESQKAERDKVETSNEVIKNEEMDLDMKKGDEILPKKNKKHKTKDHMKKSGKRETEEQNEDRVKDVNQALNSPDKENDASYLMKYNLSTTPYLESMKMHHEANDSNARDLKIVTPLRYSQRIREKMCKLSDTVKDHDLCVSSLEKLGEQGSNPTACIHKQINALKETSTDVEE
ncbi:cytoskeleton-associated protein 2 isoform X2 [Dromaius novaehollandiae]|uniref:Cytoskeleton associated protein 2 n=1 Tax=Dromaius novaehollandiae TaxID=8790 RepID=A0A8C4K8E5_DRONO|nr:cytoskeleton-associated protein 2 isoform X2 [Dromaius novaehollandiae]